MFATVHGYLFLQGAQQVHDCSLLQLKPRMGRESESLLLMPLQRQQIVTVVDCVHWCAGGKHLLDIEKWYSEISGRTARISESRRASPRSQGAPVFQAPV